MDLKHFIVKLFCIVLLIGLFSSCEKFEGEQTIPSYIYVDTFLLKNNPLIEEGRLTHNFSDIWVYVDDQIIGAFELPATIPVLQSGSHELKLYPGIWNNGISATRSPYLFIEPMTIEDFSFEIDTVLEVTPQVNYYTTTYFAWIEEFEDMSLTMVETSNSDTTLEIYSYDTPHPIYRNGSGYGVVTEDNTTLEVVSYDDQTAGFDLPLAGEPVFLEVEYNSNTSLLIGLFYRDYNEITQHAFLVLKPTDGDWNKVYVNFTPTLNNNATVDNFNVFFRIDYDSSIGDGILFLDNIKLVHHEI